MEEKNKKGGNFFTVDDDVLMQLTLADIKVTENRVTDGCSKKKSKWYGKNNKISTPRHKENKKKLKNENFFSSNIRKISVVVPTLKQIFFGMKSYGQLKLGIEKLPAVVDSDSVCIGVDNELMPNETPMSVKNIYMTMNRCILCFYLSVYS